MIYQNDIFHILFLLSRFCDLSYTAYNCATNGYCNLYTHIYEAKGEPFGTYWVVADGWHPHTTHQINECTMSKRWIRFTISNLMVFNLFLNRLFEIQNSVNMHCCRISSLCARLFMSLYWGKALPLPFGSDLHPKSVFQIVIWNVCAAHQNAAWI